MSKKVAVLYSGGMDSLVTSHLYKYLGYNITLIHFNYGQIASEIELEYTKKYADYISANLITIDSRQIFSFFNQHSLLLGKNENVHILKEAESDANYVPMRNLILLSYAGAVCEINDIPKLAFGANLTESGNYPDNSVRFFEYMSKVFKVSGKQNFQLQLKAPLINITKTEIVALGIYINAPFHLSVSCYYPTRESIACGKCGSCYLRQKAFERLGYKDPIISKEEKLSVNEKVIEIYNSISDTGIIDT